MRGFDVLYAVKKLSANNESNLPPATALTVGKASEPQSGVPALFGGVVAPFH